jgi:hypothetical protein
VGLISTSTFSASSSLSSLNRSNANATTAGGGGGVGGVLTLEQIAAFIGDLDITQYRYVPQSFFEYTYVTMLVRVHVYSNISACLICFR